MAPSSYRDRTAEFLAIADRSTKTHSSSSSSSYSSSFSSSSASSSSFAAAAAASSSRSSYSYPSHSVSSSPADDESASASLLQPADRSRSSNGVAIHSEFNKRASRIGLTIHQTSQKLSKLAKLAKRTSMFDDPAIEIQELTAVIKEDITALNSAIADLHALCSSQSESGSQSKQSSEHSVTVVDNLKSRLMSTTKEFKEVLTMRTENLKVHENRRQLFSANVSKDKNPFVRQRPIANLTSASSSTAPPWASNGSVSTPLSDMRRSRNEDGAIVSSGAQQLQHQPAMVPLQDSYMQSRTEALQNVESTIHELGSIFTQLATMVAQQGEIALRIDENIDDTLNNVEGAQGALLKYLNGISSNRWLIIKIFFVLIIFLLIFLLFVA